ncbi:hypothetical protein [Micromonospora globbae]|uniref:hypothetical protein n=1 Tax=Micromonospora globbae TaxID=1894969 RepID=UPI0037A5B907
MTAERWRRSVGLRGSLVPEEEIDGSEGLESLPFVGLERVRLRTLAQNFLRHPDASKDLLTAGLKFIM